MSEFVSDSQSGQESHLLRVSRLNEEIKHIVSISNGIYLVAVNAMLVARRAGVRARGFGVVSAELRSFSQKLEANMEEASRQVSRLVHDVARQISAERSRRRMESAVRLSERSAELLADPLARKDEARARMVAGIRDLGQGLAVQVAGAMRLCHAGSVLSRSAKIEAVYGAEMAGTLRQVSSEVDGRMSEMLERLKSLKAGVEAWQV